MSKSPSEEVAGGDLRRRLLERVAQTLQGYLDFHDQITLNAAAGWPTFSQSIRIKAHEQNKRILVADDTGVNGKTFTTVASKLNLDKQHGKRHPALIVAPNAGMLNAWAPEEVNRYASYLNAPAQNVVSVADYSDLERAGKDTDFMVVNWEKLSIRDTDPRWKAFEQAVQRVRPTFYGFDECHNGKGSGSLRGKTMRRLTDYTRGNYLILLSATPIPNRYRDLGMIFHMLDPDKYHSPEMFSHSPPEVIKELLDRQVWFRLTRQDLKEELGLPDFHEHEVSVNLSDREADVYFKAWADCVSLGDGLTELRKTLYDPRLSRYSEGQNIPSSKLEKLTSLTDRLVGEGQKVAIKTNYVTDIIDTIAQRVGKKRNVLVVYGETPLHERKERYLLFKNDPDYNILVTSQVTEESVDLTTGDVPVSQISVEPEITPREFDQWTGRFYRRGQRAPVSHYTLVTQSEHLNKLMVDYLQELAAQYKGIRIPKKFIPRTIDVDMLAMRKAKQDIVRRVYGGNHISKRDEKIYDAQEIDNAKTYLEGLLAPTTFESIPPFQMSAIIQTRWRNLGQEQFQRLVKSKGWRRWRGMYEDGWEGSASEATLQHVGKILDTLEEKAGHSLRVADVGSGAAYLSRATGRDSMTCIDIDPAFLKKGEKICEKRGLHNEYRVASATATGLPAAMADAVVNSYMIFYLGQDERRHEVESCVLETNRITKSRGHFIVTLPYSIEERAVRRFGENLGAYGFKETAYHGPKQTKSPHMKNGCHIGVYQKTAAVAEAQGKDLSFYSNRVRFVQ